MSSLPRLLLCAATALAAACRPTGSPSAGNASLSGAAAGRGAAAAARPAFHRSDYSVHDLDGSWRDHDGRARSLASLGGKVQVVAMVYTRCTHTCPAVLAEFKTIEAALPTGQDRIGFVLVSMDPTRDTPARLREFAASARLDLTSWTLLAGGEEQVRELAALLGVRYRPEAGGEFSHANVYLVLDPQGRVALRQDGLNGTTMQNAAFISSLAGYPPASNHR